MPAVELVAMIDPPPLSIRCGTAVTIEFHTPVRLVSSVSCHTCGVTSFHACTVQMPAFAHTMSRRPSSLTPSASTAVNVSTSRTSALRAMMRRSSASTARTVSSRSAWVAMPYCTVA